MNNKPNTFKWLILAIGAFFIFVVLQVPAAWLIAKFYKNNQVVHNVNGNIWQGSADWKKGNLNGSLNWQLRPLDFLLLRTGANIDVHSGNTKISGIVSYGLGKTLHLKDLQGQLAPETLKSIADWQWPTNPIQFSNVSLKYKKQQGFNDAVGDMQWSGGELLYTFAQRQERMNVPVLAAQMADENGQLLIDVRDNREQKMMNIKLDADLMLDVQLTQRLLLNVPSYEGNAGLDTFVISTRQPLMGAMN
ncbi:general secretion pathway protein [Acinetobacter sp. NCu2D-2]|uniref:type II secretion system protein N n=1 Tax=Acinetobacter sp. NCu2D-2 TaxID=1608473 RepID=UPI0007CDB8E1|nr:type II secretion system protein N [Acinetobacter sp. NCu2D-2]ANF80859.1 general secretion pathway protein [Acinetobacter sp. NCu2D-2]